MNYIACVPYLTIYTGNQTEILLKNIYIWMCFFFTSTKNANSVTWFLAGCQMSILKKSFLMKY